MSVTNALPTGDQVVQNLPWRWKVQGKIFLIGGLGFMFDAWDVTLNGVLIPLLSKEWDLVPAQAAWIGTANLLGMAIGAFVWGSIADAIGRKRAFSATLLVFSIFTVLGAFSPDIVWFCIFRFMAGFGLGGCVPVDYALVGEFTPKKQRGRVLTGMDGWWPVGAALCGVTSAAIMATFADWRYTMLIMVIPAFLVFWVRRSVPESPLYLVRMGRTEEASAVIDDLVRRTGGTQTEWHLPEPQAPEKLSLRTVGTQLTDLWRFSAKTTIAAWSLFLTILLVYYLALQWMPKILVDAGFAEHRAFLTTSGMAAVGLLGVIVAALLVEKVGRKWILAITGPLSAAILVVVALVVDVPAAATVLLLVYGFVVQVAIPVLYAYVSELYPTNLRGSGFGWASTVSRIGAGFGPLIFVSVLWPYLGLPMSFALAGVLVLMAVLWMARFAPETKGAALD
ncbi:MFS transporter [Arthrobacter sp. zg-Y1110]|uniref:MFS transporter n=1 Tax=Arthrobacter sp. zg-Y1110 TaxID=2886932 RepID=UPI001D1468CC|nr:MFS transporter [Arthrobacter sp. zg-Y1110]MCC3291911.1 MFS transporter [Arthrobacter sp. zg-Y1110]UWX85737.1 MFS transporter [Arthrobacter sp. zg-Y1110]